MPTQDPAGTLQWASSIADPNLRGAQMQQLANRKLKANPATVRE
jgi:hypothetical protein